PPHPAPPHDPRTGDRLHRGRRAGRGDPQVDPPAQAGPESQLPQEAAEGTGVAPGRRSPEGEEGVARPAGGGQSLTMANPIFASLPTTIFEEMSGLARRHGA